MRRRRRIGWWIRLGLGALASIVVAGVLAAWMLLRASLPQTGGQRRLAGLHAAVTVTRDHRGVPVIIAASRADAAAALGFLHAQDRFFQMDLQRRTAAGELAELVGRAALNQDRSVRVHRFRARATTMLARWTPEERRVATAYTRGVQAGLEALRAAPFEYFLLRAEPAAWRDEDTILVGLAMFLDLQDGDGAHESAHGLIHDVLPDSLARFLTADGGDWDAPLSGEARTPPAVPSAACFDLRRAAAAPRSSIPDAAPDDFAAGSNNWVVDAAHSTSGRALVAGDMHLGLRIPNIWYRAVLAFDDSTIAGGRRRVAGVTLPGVPALIAGSNGEVAWAFTNSQIDASDLVVLETAGDDAYRAPDGPRRFDVHTEFLRVHGGATDTLRIRQTIWGPVIDRDHLGRERALRWVAHDDDAVNLGLLRLEVANSLDEALALAGTGGIPAQNAVFADRSGRIGWTLLGKIPARFGLDGRLPASWADGERGWRGGLVSQDVPRIADPATGKLWTANQRLVDGDALARIGDAGYALGARARQIRDALHARATWSPSDMLALQLDDRALFLERWRGLFLAALPLDLRAAAPRRARAAALVEDWGGHAAVGSAGYRIVRAFRDLLADEILSAVAAPCAARDPDFRTWWIGPQREYAAWSLLRERPAHLLPPRHRSWDACILAAVDSTIVQLQRTGPDLAARTWGERNRARIRHPLSLAVPALGRWLDMPRTPLPGDAHMPRVQSPAAGASQRFVVSPGDEAAGIFHMPGGQSGHPWSPHYRDGHAAWESGAAEPFLPGAAVDTLRLLPAP